METEQKSERGKTQYWNGTLNKEKEWIMYILRSYLVINKSISGSYC